MDNSRKSINMGVAAIYWLLVMGYMGTIYYLSSQESFNLPRLPENFDKVAHVCIYIPLAFLIYFALTKSGLNRFVLISTIFITILYGVADEFHQSFVPNRVPALDDLIADSLGAFLGSVTANFFKT